MTTTAEKINDIEEQMDLISDALQTMGEQIARLKGLKEDIKPADHEPLECWVNVLEGGVLVIHRTLEDAVKPNYGGPTRKRSGIYMREVTPQDEQDRKDAAQYRYLKREGKNLLYPFEADEWDEMIEKAVESDER